MNDSVLMSRRDKLMTLALWADDLNQGNAQPSFEKMLSLMSEEMFFLKPNRIQEFFRKAGVRLGLTHDYRSIKHRDSIRRVCSFRKKYSRFSVGDPAKDQPRFLLRVDDFPSAASDSKKFLEFHEKLKSLEIPYLLAVTPFLNGSRGLKEDEVNILRRCSLEGAEIALHGFTHESRQLKPKSELFGMPENELIGKIGRSRDYLSGLGLPARAFIAPFNSYDEKTFHVLAKEFPLLCGGPESTDSLGGLAGPVYLRGSLYIPSYRGVYDDFSLLTRNSGDLKMPAHLPVPVTVHWTNGIRDGWKNFDSLFSAIRHKTVSWNSFLDYAEKTKAKISREWGVFGL